MKTITIECRKFEEWDKATQEKILDKNWDINIDYEDWAESELEYWKEELENLGYYDCKIAYSGFWSQGDGASFTGKVDLRKWLNKHHPGEYDWELDLLDKSIFYVDYAEFRRTSSHYYHENSTEFNFTYGIEYEEIPNCPEPRIEEIEKLITSHHRLINKQIYEDVEELYDSLTSDEQVKKALIANEYEFNNNGEIM